MPVSQLSARSIGNRFFRSEILQPRFLRGLALAVAAFIVLRRYLHRQPDMVSRPINAGYDTGWSTWWDQGKYLEAAQAWGRGDLDPAHHWYLPGYPLLGALFTHLTPVQPFLIPDLACLIAATWLFALLTAQLAPKLPYGRSLGALVFLGTLIVSPKLLDAWIVPWTTTPPPPLIFACLLTALRFGAYKEARSAFLAAASGAGIALFRPTETIALAIVIVPFMAGVLLSSPLGRRAKLWVAAAAAGGAALPLAVLLATYYAIHGLAADPYLVQASWIGLEWRSLPLQWVTIFVSPRPLLPEGYGLAQGFPWVAAGVAGMAAIAVAARRSERAGHILVIAAVISDCALNLAFRDLHPQGLWRYSNYHYFKWVLPVFALYAVLLVIGLTTAAHRLRMAAAGILAVCALFAWRVEWLADGADDAGITSGAVISSPHQLTFQGGPRRVGDGVLFRATDKPSWESVYFGGHAIRVAGETFPVNAALKIVPVGDGLLLTLLRPLPAGTVTLVLDPDVTIDPDFKPVVGRKHVVFGFPCWSRSVCR